MYSTIVYNYTQRQTVVLNVGNSPRRYNTVYAKTMKLHKGVDNVLQFQFLNQEQKPVSLPMDVGNNTLITLRLISADGNRLLKEYTLVSSLPLTGIAELQVPAVDMDDFDAQHCHYSLEIPSGSFNVPVFVDSAAGGRGKIEIVNSVMPNFVPSLEVTIPTHHPVYANQTSNILF